MAREVKIIKDMKVVLKDFEPMVKQLDHLWHGRDIENFSLRPREAWSNWLICAVLRFVHGNTITFADDNSGDGFIVDRETGIAIPIEHVSALDIPYAPSLPSGEQRIIDAVLKKAERGEQYARGKILAVFFDGAGTYYRNKIREAIKGKHSFDVVYCVGLLNSDSAGYSYAVTEFRDSYGETSMTHVVKISSSFDSWSVEQVLE